MSLPKKKFREIVFQLLYSHDLSAPEAGDVIPMMMRQLEVSRSNLRAAYDYMQEVMAKVDDLDEQIASSSEEYELERIHRVERNVLRLSIYELLYDEGVPAKVSIAEGLRIAKKFSTPEAVKFVNAILDRVAREAGLLEEGEAEEDKMETFFNNEEQRED